MEEIIIKKRDGFELSEEEIKYFIKGYSEGNIPDYQAAALLMAIYFNDISERETINLTEAMMLSGDIVDLSKINGIKIDKHSTGGVGDKTTLIVGPMAAAAGIPVAKMSGRGLGFTGGTVDKLEAVLGYRTSLEYDEFVKNVNEIGISIIGQTSHIAPADKKLYALRDVTGTVENMGLITASIMSKKLASGSDGIILDVKSGKGGFMKNPESSKKLAELMVKIGKAHGKKVAAIITSMEEPLGNTVGNSLEVIEAIETLKGQGPEDIKEICICIAAHMILLGEKAGSYKEAAALAENTISSGEALEKFKDMVKRQGGDSNIVDDYSLLKKSPFKKNIVSNTGGYITKLDAQLVGEAAKLSGAGREKKEDNIDFGAGIELYRKIGDEVKNGDRIAAVFSSDKEKLENAVKRLEKAIAVENVKPDKIPLIIDIMES